MNEAELNALVETKLADRLAVRLQADRERVRAEVVADLRREAERKHYDRINARHPIEGPLSGLTPAQHEARLKAMDARAKAEGLRLDAINRRPVEGSLLHQRSRAALVPGSEGFRVKG
jgi:hypothetical protein